MPCHTGVLISATRAVTGLGALRFGARRAYAAAFTSMLSMHISRRDGTRQPAGRSPLSQAEISRAPWRAPPPSFSRLGQRVFFHFDFTPWSNKEMAAAACCAREMRGRFDGQRLRRHLSNYDDMPLMGFQ